MTDGQSMPPAAATAPPSPPWSPGPELPPGLLGWMTFVAIMTIISGVLSILSCFGIVNGILMLVAGIALLGAKGALAGAQSFDAPVAMFFGKFKTFLVALGVTYILGIVVFLLISLLWGGAILAAIASGAAS